MKTNILIIIITLFAMSSCAGKKKDLNSKEEVVVSRTDSVNFFNSEFCQCVYEYIKYAKGGNSMYYSVYFFSKDNIDYFTIWAEYISYLERPEYNNSICIKINDIDVLVIGKDIQLYQCCNLIQQDNIYNHFHRFIYGIRLFVETYRYSLQQGKYVLDKLDTPIMDFFDDVSYWGNSFPDYSNW